jgi:peptidoglycan hydrolase-like protein with peptidoglycan-binding domain
MNNVVGHFVILAGAGIAAVALSVAFGRSNQAASPDEATVVVMLPQRAAEPATRAPSGESPRPAPPPGDRASLTRELQRELKRVGCYEGEISGVWTPSSRLAMKGFTDQVNARLPIDQPDYILLKLVQNQKDKVCGKPCPTGLVTAQDGRCVAEATLASIAKKPEPQASPEPIVAKASPPPADAKSEPVPAVPPERPRVASVVPTPDPKPDDLATGSERSRGSPRADAPVPPDGLYERRPRHRAQSKPPKIVRSLIRNVQRTLAPLRLPF